MVARMLPCVSLAGASLRIVRHSAAAVRVAWRALFASVRRVARSDFNVTI